MRRRQRICGLVLASALAGPCWAQATAAHRAPAAAAMCTGCHGIEGYRSSFPEVYSVPRIQGQAPGYLQAALRAYRDGGRRHPTMRAIAAGLTDSDISELAGYYGEAR